MKIVCSRQVFIERTDRQTDICIYWAPVGAKKASPKDFKHYSDEVACLLLSINERQNIWFSKYHHGEELTENEVMST